MASSGTTVGHFFHFKSPRDRGLDARAHARSAPAHRAEALVHRVGRSADRLPLPEEHPPAAAAGVHRLPARPLLRARPPRTPRRGRARGARRGLLRGDALRALRPLDRREASSIPYNEKLYATRQCSRLDKDAMGRFFPHADLSSTSSATCVAPDNGGYNASFTYPRGRGHPGTCTRSLHDAARPERLALLGAGHRRRPRGTCGDDARSGVCCATTGSSPACPSTACVSASAGCAHDPGVFSWNKVLVFNLGFDRKGQTRRPLALRAVARDVVFYRVGFYDNIFGDDKMSLYVEIGLPQDAEVPSDPREIDARWLDRVLIDLAAIGVTDGHQLASHHCGRCSTRPTYTSTAAAPITELRTARRAYFVSMTSTRHRTLRRMDLLQHRRQRRRGAGPRRRDRRLTLAGSLRT